MSATPSTMLALGTVAPSFALPEVVSNRIIKLADLSDKKGLLVIFLCAHCPYVQHVAPELARISRDYASASLAIIGITSNDVAQYPQDAPEPTLEWAQQEGLGFPILFDESQGVAKSYTAACTPDFFLFGPDRTLVYRGQIDDSRPMRGPDRPGKGQLNGREIRAAIDAVLAGQPVSDQQMPSIGCNVKWKPGNEPAYFG